MTKVAVIGAGISGLAFSHYLGAEHEVSVYERFTFPGGLARCFEIEGTRVEAFYHHFFLSDHALINLLTELDLADRIRFFPSSVAIHYDGETLPFSTPGDLLKFGRLPMFSRIAFGLHVLYLSHTGTWERFEKDTVEDWMARYFGRRIYREIWGPLLAVKFGEHAEEIRMSWLWGRIHPRAASREKTCESLGYLKGSLAILFDTLVEKIKENGGNILFNCPILRISVKNDCVEVSTKEGVKQYDLVILTVDTNEVLKTVENIPQDAIDKLRMVRYFGIVCFVLKLREPLGGFYWINNANPNLPISGIIEHTNLVPRDTYNGHSLVYVFRYLSPLDPLYSTEREELYRRFCAAVRYIFPRFRETDVLERFFFRAPNATPVYTGRYSGIRPP
jgi:protoporphyrinogen oxidase